MSEPPSLFPDALDLLDALSDERVEYVLVGAHAMAAHGVPRATGDVDILVRPTPENAARVVRALTAFGAPLEAHGVSVQDFAREGMVYQLGLEPRRLDLLTSISGVGFEEASRDRLEVDLSGRRVPVLSVEALIKNKLSTGREKDRLDVAALRKKR